jgi:two-component sensor histidine kinase
MNPYCFVKKATYIYSILVAFLLTLDSYGSENQQIDSLKNALFTESLQDSARFKAYQSLAIAYEPVNLDSAVHYYDQAIEFGQEHEWDLFVAHATFNKSFLYHYRLFQDTSITIVKDAIRYYRKADYQKGVTNCYYTIGTYWANFEQFDSSIYYLEEAKEIGEQIQDSFYLNRIYNNLGLMYQYVGINDLSIENTLKALEIKEALDAPDIGKSYVNLGLTYSSNGSRKQAIEYFRRGLAYSNAQLDTASIALCTKNIGNEYAGMQMYDSAQMYYDDAYELFEAINDSNAMARVYLSYGEMSVDREKYDLALLYAETGLSIYPKNNPIKRLKIGLLRTLSTAELELSKSGERSYWQNAQKHAEEALELSKELGLIAYEATSIELLFKIHRGLGEYKIATDYASELSILNDSLNQAERTKSLSEQQIRFEAEKKELMIQSLNRENELKTASLLKSEELRSTQKVIIWLLVGGIVIFAGLIIGIFRLYKQRTSYASKLEEQNKLISNQKEEKEVLLKEIHHRVKNNLQVVIALLELQDSALKDAQFSEAVKISQQRVRSMALIHELLYKNEDVGKFVFSEYIQNLLQQVRDSYANRDTLEYTLDFEKNVQFDLDTAIPLGLIITELFTNAAKYGADDNGRIKVSISCKKISEKRCLLTVRDTGQGLAPNFELSKAKSLGVRLVHKLAKQLKGTVDYHFDHGAVFSITFTHD